MIRWTWLLWLSVFGVGPWTPQGGEQLTCAARVESCACVHGEALAKLEYKHPVWFGLVETVGESRSEEA